MKKLLTILLFGFALKSHSQDTVRQMRQIDSIVFAINHSQLFATSHDSTVQDFPAVKLYVKTYLTMVTNGKELKKYINKGFSRTEENGIEQNLASSSAFYYDAGQLIKVEEYVTKGNFEQKIEWYYADVKPLRFITTPATTVSQRTKLKERETQLISMAEVLRKTVEAKL